MFLSEKHFLFTSSEEMNTVCQPLFDHYKIKYFNYYRYYCDGSLHGLITTPKVMKYHFNKEHIFSPCIHDNISSKQFSYILMPSLNDKFSQVVYDYQSFFDLYHPIYLFEISEYYFDLFIYSYAGHPSEAINYYLTHMDVLENFKTFFKEKAHHLMKESEKNKIILPENMHTNFRKSDTVNHPMRHARKYTLECDEGLIELSEREMDCVKCLIKGMTAKQTAKMLSISHRTVETYRENLKRKTNVTNKYELINKFAKSPLFQSHFNIPHE